MPPYQVARPHKAKAAELLFPELRLLETSRVVWTFSAELPPREAVVRHARKVAEPRQPVPHDVVPHRVQRQPPQQLGVAHAQRPLQVPRDARHAAHKAHVRRIQQRNELWLATATTDS